MPITFYEDDHEPDAMDQYKRQAEQQAQTVTPAFTPHCPACLKPLINWACHSCGRVCATTRPIYLRPLTPQPAPPYTQDEIDQLVYEVA
jgi:hypothetical protein